MWERQEQTGQGFVGGGVAKVREYLSASFRQLFPGHCVLCELTCASSRDLCEYCEQSLPWNLPACATCAAPLAAPEGPCHYCAHAPSSLAPITLTVAPFRYAGSIRHWLAQLKFHRSLVYGRLLGDLLATALEHRYLIDAAQRTDHEALPDVLVPMPLHWWRLGRRGLNQALVLAQPVSKRLGIPVNDHALVRRGWRPSQRGLNADDRQANLLGAFHSATWQGQHIALVDDVTTTGATGNYAAHACLRAGARRVDLWCVAITPRAGGGAEAVTLRPDEQDAR